MNPKPSTNGSMASSCCIPKVLKRPLNEVLGDAKGFRESVQVLHNFGDIFFSEEFLEPRPLMKAPQRRQRLYFADRRDR